MKITAISGDMLVKLALGAAVLGGLGYLLWKAKTLIADNVHLVDPTSADNVAYHTVTQIGGALVTDPNGAGKNADGSWTLGGAIYDLTHPAAFKP